MSGEVPIEELEALMQEWDMNAKVNKLADTEGVEDGSNVAAGVLRDCAQELQETINKYD